MISIIILTKNEEDQIVDCIKSIKVLADEVIVVDSNSTDKTAELAKKSGASVYERDLDNFSNQRNFGYDKSHGDWVLYLDADERATESFIREVRDVLSGFDEKKGIGGYFIKRQTYFYGKDWKYYDTVQRLFYRKCFKAWFGTVHETPKIEGVFSELSFPILHFTHRDLSHMVDKTNSWSEFEADLRFKSDHPQMSGWRFFRVMLTGFLKSYIFENGFRNGTAGLVESIYQAFSMFVTYAKLWEMQVRHKKH